VVEQGGAQAGFAQASQHRFAQPGLMHARIGDHEHVAVAVLGAADIQVDDRDFDFAVAQRGRARASDARTSTGNHRDGHLATLGNAPSSLHWSGD
jgi:hypothetical protein